MLLFQNTTPFIDLVKQTTNNVVVVYNFLVFVVKGYSQDIRWRCSGRVLLSGKPFPLLCWSPMRLPSSTFRIGDREQPQGPPGRQPPGRRRLHPRGCRPRWRRSPPCSHSTCRTSWKQSTSQFIKQRALFTSSFRVIKIKVLFCKSSRIV